MSTQLQIGPYLSTFVAYILESTICISLLLSILIGSCESKWIKRKLPYWYIVPLRSPTFICQCLQYFVTAFALLANGFAPILQDQYPASSLLCQIEMRVLLLSFFLINITTLMFQHFKVKLSIVLMPKTSFVYQLHRMLGIGIVFLFTAAISIAVLSSGQLEQMTNSSFPVCNLEVSLPLFASFVIPDFAMNLAYLMIFYVQLKEVRDVQEKMGRSPDEYARVLRKNFYCFLVITASTGLAYVSSAIPGNSTINSFAPGLCAMVTSIAVMFSARGGWKKNRSDELLPIRSHLTV